MTIQPRSKLKIYWHNDVETISSLGDSGVDEFVLSSSLLWLLEKVLFE